MVLTHLAHIDYDQLVCSWIDDLRVTKPKRKDSNGMTVESSNDLIYGFMLKSEAESQTIASFPAWKVRTATDWVHRCFNLRDQPQTLSWRLSLDQDILNKSNTIRNRQRRLDVSGSVCPFELCNQVIGIPAVIHILERI